MGSLVIERKRHSVNGRHYGWWVTFPDGRIMYVAYRASTREVRGYCRRHDAWALDLRLLNEMKARGVCRVGLIHGKKSRRYYATLAQDFFGPLSRAWAGKDSTQRLLPRNAWRVNPMADEGNIAKAMRLH